MPTRRSVTTKAAIVPRAVFDFRRGVDVLEWALFVETSAELLIKVTLGHFGHIVLVEELAIVAFLAKTAQPMLANHRSVSPDVSIGAHSFPLAVASGMKVANGRGRLVHAREGIGEDSDMVVKGDLYIEDVIVVDRAH